MRRVASLFGVGLLVLASVVNVGAQQFTGGLRGAVSDANGVIPGVAVTLLNEETAISRDTVTNETGQYNFSAVTPGTYTLRAVLAGFKTYERKGIRIGTQQFITLDVTMEVGQISEEISVTADAPLIETSNASIGDSLNREILENLPAPGRAAFLIAVTVPTVNPIGDPQFNRQQDQSNASLISLGGGGVRANNYLLDGVPITEMTGRAIANPSMEGIDEVKVQVHTYDSEMGRTGGGVFNTTARSGTNEYHGSAFWQTRPVWGQTENYFNEVAGLSKEETGLADSYFHTYGGGVGGPIIRNRLFFWTATEGYRSQTTRNGQEIWPGLNQRAGNFSQTTAGGSPVRIFNPWCRGGVATAQCPATGTGSIETGGEFTGAVIPRNHPAASQTGFNIANSWPTVTNLGNPIAPNEDGEVNVSTTAQIHDTADLWSIKSEMKFTDTWSLSGFYLYNNTNEPGSEEMAPEFIYLDGAHSVLRRRPHILVFNNTNILNDTTILSLRYGWTTWQDQSDKGVFPAGMASLGFSPAFVNEVDPSDRDLFPDIQFDTNRDVGGIGGNTRRWTGPYAINGAVSKLWGNHTFKVGADFRELGIKTTTEDNMAGSFTFNRNFTGRSGIANSGHEVASLLLGLPRSGNSPINRGFSEWYVKYWGGYVQDDWRVNNRLTLNYGLRFEHEDGLREIDNKQTVAFDTAAVNPIDSLVNKTGTLLAGRTLTGGLIFAGVDGAPEEQGDLPALTVSPRVGVAYSATDRTVFRGGYGLFYAPWQFSATTHGQIGFTRQTELIQTSADSTEVPLTTLDNPFPTGLEDPFGSSLGLLTGVGGVIEFIDQTKGQGKVHQYSIDVQQELGANMSVTVGYTGATGRDIGYGGTGNPGININQIDPAVARAAFPGPNGTWDAAALNRSVPNPFFGIAAAGELGKRATVAQGQLLRPFPQFGNVNMFEKTDGGKRQFHSVTVKLDKRTGQSWWGGRFHYTWSSTEDNQFGQGSFFASSTATPQNNYDLDAEYGVSNFDSPHRIILAPIFRIPGPSEDSGWRWLLGDWTSSAIVEFVSGAPVAPVVSQGRSDTNLGLFGGRLRPNAPTGDATTPGSDTDRVADANHLDARWFDRTVFATPAAGTYGTAARTIDDARWQFRKNMDVVFAKNVRFASTQSGEIRFEILNITNTPKFASSGNTNQTDLATFGRVTSQGGFSRIWQLTFRYKF
jgi:hypothetical protein